MGKRKISRRQALKEMGALGVAGLLSQKACQSPLTAGGSQNEVPGATLPPTERWIDPSTRTPEDSEVYLPYITQEPIAQNDYLNFIVIMCDTLRYDHIGFHGNSNVHTPYIDDFAAQSVVFDRAYAGGFPTLLNRAELFTGRYTFTYMGWEDMHQDEVVLAQTLNEVGYTTGVVFDTWHLKAHQFSFDRGFQSWHWIRGQENDRYHTTPLAPTLPADPSKLRHGTQVIQQYLRNVSKRQSEADYFCAQTMQTAIEWLRDIYDKNGFFLQIDTFDPHEPWDPPQSYVDLYDPDYVGEEVIYPAYAPANFLTPEELSHTRALYAAEVSLVDRWLGALFAELDQLGLWDNTVVFLTADHGILLGEHGAIGKAWSHEGYYECYPLYEELIHIPLMVRAPGVPPRRISDLAQPADIMPTILEWAGARPPSTIQGASLVAAIEDQEGSHTPPHDYVISGRSLKLSPGTEPRCTVTDGEWTLIDGGGHAASELYYLPDDPQQETNLLWDHCDVARNLHAQFIAFLESQGTLEDYIAPWRPAPC